MVALVAGTTDIAEEVELGRTLLGQGHADTAQRVLLKACQGQPECAAAFRALAEVLRSRGDGSRAHSLVEYADELDGTWSGVPAATLPDVPSDEETHQHRLSSRGIPAPVVVSPVVGEVVAPEPTPLPKSPFPVRAPSSPALSRRPNRRRDLAVLVVAACAVAAVAAVAAFSQRGKARPPGATPREELDRALASGTLEVLMRARDVARMALVAGVPDADSFVRLGLVNAFLVQDYGVEAAKKDAEEALKLSEGVAEGLDVSKDRASLAATTRAMLALAAGDRVGAKRHADAAVALVSPDPPAWALLAAARVRVLSGDAAGATRDLDRALGMASDSAPVVADWAASRLDGGDPVAARRALAAALEKFPDNSRLRLLLADAERALGETDWVKNLDVACRGDAKISRNVRTMCAVESALQSRLDGDRALALRKAKAAAQTSEDPQLLGQASLLLALLGEIDSAEDILVTARRFADPAAAFLEWADLAVRLGRGEAVQPSPFTFTEHPSGPERDLVALRLAYARGGMDALATALKGLPPGIQDIDWDIRAFAALAPVNGPSKQDLLTLEKRGEKGNPLASYVLGVLAIRDKNFKLAARRLEKAFSLHGDTCEAATQYLAALKRVGRGAQPNKSGLRGIHLHNAKCALPEM
jgi:Flp pilus assembly protein TadD